MASETHSPIASALPQAFYPFLDLQIDLNVGGLRLKLSLSGRPNDLNFVYIKNQRLVWAHSNSTLAFWDSSEPELELLDLYDSGSVGSKCSALAVSEAVQNLRLGAVQKKNEGVMYVLILVVSLHSVMREAHKYLVFAIRDPRPYILYDGGRVRKR